MLNQNSNSLWVYFLVSLEHNEVHLLNVNTVMNTGALQEDLHDKVVLQYVQHFQQSYCWCMSDCCILR